MQIIRANWSADRFPWRAVTEERYAISQIDFLCGALRPQVSFHIGTDTDHWVP
jgi:hypothetical protein